MAKKKESKLQLPTGYPLIEKAIEEGDEKFLNKKKKSLIEMANKQIAAQTQYTAQELASTTYDGLQFWCEEFPESKAAKWMVEMLEAFMESNKLILVKNKEDIQIGDAISIKSGVYLVKDFGDKFINTRFLTYNQERTEMLERSKLKPIRIIRNLAAPTYIPNGEKPEKKQTVAKKKGKDYYIFFYDQEKQTITNQ